MPYLFIVNTRAANEQAGKAVAAIKSNIQRENMQAELHITTSYNDAAKWAQRAAEEGKTVVAAGGDGTVQSVASGILQAEQRVPLGIVPLGTGNDFARAIRVPQRPKKAIRIIAEGFTRRIDCGKVTWHEGETSTRQIFMNAVGIGLDAAVAHAVQHRKSIGGPWGYLQEALSQLRGWVAPNCTVETENEAGQALVWMGPLLLCTAGNGRSSGGGLLLTPQAKLDDGLLDVCLVPELSGWRIARIIPHLFTGRIAHFEEIRYVQTKRLTVESPRPLPLHADGETLSQQATRVEVDLNGQIDVLAPVDG